MKKLFRSGLIVTFSALILSACLKQSSSQQVQAPEQQTGQEALQEWQELGTALAEGKAAHCQILNTETNQTGEYYMKGEKVRYELSNPTDPEQAGSFISDGEWVYSWSEDTKQGMKFAVTDPEEEAEAMEDQGEAQEESSVPDLTDQSAWDGFEQQGFTVDCNIEEVDDAQFIPPTDVEFVDFAQMMMDAFEKMPKNF